MADRLADSDAAATLESAWQAHAAAPADLAARHRLIRLLRAAPGAVAAGREPDLHRLLLDRGVNPRLVAPAGWALLLREGRIPAEGPAQAEWLEQDGFARALLCETVVTTLPAELALTALRRWLLLSGESPRYPMATGALIRQAAHNGGAWPFAADEQARLDADPDARIAAAYLPPRPALAATAAFSTPVTSDVAAQYESWPYPSWERAGTRTPSSLPDIAAALGPGAPRNLPRDGHLLVAGCGTGHDAANWAMRCPEAHITAIDISATSLAYAAERCERMGLTNIRFLQLDLHDAATLGIRFDAITSTGVLHHLADPEAGWAALVDVLRPGGLMHLMLYSRLARLFRIRPAQALLAGLRERPVDDALLREARARLIRDAPDAILWGDFFTLAGVYDLLLHVHEDTFDVPRIRAAIDRFGLDFLGFALPTKASRARYQAAHPHDPWYRDYEAWAATELRNPMLFAGMYRFWCAKPDPAC